MQGYNPCMKLLSLTCCALLCSNICAQTVQPASAQAPKELPEPKVEQLKTSDDAVQIDELRVRGESKSIKVTPKNAPAYDISPQSPAKRADDKSQGVRTWRLFSF